MSVKQIIVIRKDLNMRKGKMVAQAAHASMKFLTYTGKLTDKGFINDNLNIFDEELKIWLEGSFTKICVSVNSEAELDALYEEARNAGLRVEMIIDNGYTEFHNVPTKTCIAIGPHYAEKLDSITGKLPLL